MERNVRVGIWGFGAMGSGMAQMLLKKKGIDIIAVCDRNEQRVGKSMYDVLETERGDRPEVIITSNEEEAFGEKSADVVLLATDSFTKNAFNKINSLGSGTSLPDPYSDLPLLYRILL